MYGGITNIEMSKEDPFVVINRYPIQQHIQQTQPLYINTII